MAGFLDVLDTLELSDEQKEQLRQGHAEEITPLEEAQRVSAAQARKATVEKEIEELGKLGFSDQPGMLAFVRRVYLSDDQEPGIVLLSDGDLELDKDEATGAKSREEKSTAEVLRHFISLIPRNDDGKIALSDQILASDAIEEKPEEEEGGDEEKKKIDSRKRAEKLLGRPITRKGRGGEEA